MYARRTAFHILIALAMVLGFGAAALPTGSVSANALTVCAGGGCDYTTIQAAIAAASAGDTITVAAGTYVEDVNINKSLTITGAGAATTKIVATTGNATTLNIGASGASVSGFTITHEYTPAELAAWNFNNNGVNFAQGTSGSTLQNCIISLNRNGIYLNNSQNNIITGNIITDNRTGMNMTNDVNGTQITSNTISDNWTLGIVLYGLTTNLSTLVVTGNTFSNNWYTEILIKDATAGATGSLNVTSNTFTDVPLTYTTSADASLNEPAFVDQKPVHLGGTATKPVEDLPTLRIYNSPNASITSGPKTLLVGAGKPYTTIQAAIDAATAGDVIEIFGTHILSTAVNVNKDVTLSCDPAALIQVSGTGDRIDISAAGATLQGCSIQKTDKTGEQNIIRIRASGVTIQDNTIWGQFIIGDGEVSRAMVINAGAFSDLLIIGNEIYALRQPAYISGTHTGVISNNFVHGTKGWVLEGGNLTFTGNTWGTGANANVYDIAILGTMPAAYYTDIPAMSAANNNASIEDQRTAPATLNPVYVDDSAAAGGNGTAALPYQTITAGIARVTPGGTIHVAAGTYVENIIVNKPVEIAGANQAAVIVRPAVSNPNPCTGSSLCGGAASNVFLVQANDVTIHDLTIDGDNPALTSGIVRNGADLDARNGIIKNTDATYNNLEVYNTTVQNIYLRGIYSTDGSFNFHHNTVTNVAGDGYSIGMFAWGGPGTIASNTVSYANDAISANHSRGIQFLNNTVTHSGSGVHTDNSNDGGGVADLIQGNSVDCTGVADAYGVWTFVPYAAPIVDGNTITNCAIGLSAWGSGNTSIAQFTNNTLTGPVPNTGSVGIYVTTSEAGWGYADIYADFTGNIVTGFEYGIQLSADETTWDPDPYVAKTITSTFTHNQIVGSTTMLADQGTTGTYVANLEANWWGSITGPQSLIDPDLDYNPWCGDAACSFLVYAVTPPQTIQAAIDAAAPGDAIYVTPGTYPEHLTINKPLTLLGADKATTIIDGGGTGLVVTIQGTSNVTLSGFTIQNSGSNINADGGIGLIMSTGCTIEDNIIQDNASGIGLLGASGNTIQNNTIDDSARYGIVLDQVPGVPSLVSTNNLIDNNIITDSGRDGIYVGQDSHGQTITNNTISGAYGTTEGTTFEGNGIYFWKSKNNTITGNTIYNNVRYGMELMGSSGNTINGNTIYANLDGMRIRASGWPAGAYPFYPFGIGANTFGSGNTQYDIAIEIPRTLFTNLPLPDVFQAVLDQAPYGSTILVPGSTQAYAKTGAFTVNNPGLTIVLQNGVIIQNSSPCFVVNADFTTITTASIGGAQCVPTSGSNGIDVTGVRKNITITGIEFVGAAGTDGIHFGTSGTDTITDLVLTDNWIHGFADDGVEFFTQPLGILNIQGNLFQTNGGLGINNANGTTPIDAEYNSWGDYAGPTGANGDGVSTNVGYTPWTHVNLYMTSSGTPWANQVVSGQTITYTVYGDLLNTLSVDFALVYPSNLTLLGAPVESGFFSSFATFDTATPNTIRFHGLSTTAPGTPNGTFPIFSATFTAGAPVTAAAMNLDETSDAFGMQAYESSSNIYAAALADGSVTIIGLPTLTSASLTDTYIIGTPNEFTLTINNPTTGAVFTDPALVFTLPAGSVLEYKNGTVWESVTGPFDPGTLAASGTDVTLTFRLTLLVGPGSYPLTVELFDTLPTTDALLATTTANATVTALPAVVGTVSMQGRATRAGVPMTLTALNFTAYGPFTATSVNQISSNITFSGLASDTYRITTNQPRYLNLTAAENKTKLFSAGVLIIAPLELKGGNAVWSDNEIGVLDASMVGTQYGSSGTTYDGDVNFSGKVDINDLAMVGGNYGLNSTGVYGGSNWVP